MNTIHNKTNRLSQEKSPYLAQHATNPVDWYPWGPEALERARIEDKPIFVSIGYSTCHWCHVMAHESFENAEIATLMNQKFVNIKIDREERPDLDALYMLSVQMISGSGGWPLSIWLTPELKPFFGGTYFPPDDRYGRPGFPTVLTQLAQLWENNRDNILKSSQEITDLLAKASHITAPKNQVSPDFELARQTAITQLSQSYDPVYGGFGHAPKFPMPVNLQLMLYEHQKTGNKKLLEMVHLTLEKMAQGGIYDQLGGGFARYSTDERWIVPHFEKMLYDNAQLLSVYVEFTRQTSDLKFVPLIQETIQYILRDMTHAEGGFYSAEDADSEGKEGTFYLWTLKELRDVLGAEFFDLAAATFGVTVHGNFKDPHTDETGKNILTQMKSLSEVAVFFKKTEAQIESSLEQIRALLFAHRAKRIRPHLDDKILTGWNGLMISALAQAGMVLQNSSYVTAAEKAALFIENNLFDPTTQQLFRRWKDGEKRYAGQQPDYALLIQGLLDLFEATGNPHWLKWTLQLQKTHDDLFFDSIEGGYFMTLPQSDLLIRLKDESDNVIPSGNSIAVWNLVRLFHLTGHATHEEKAQQTIAAFSTLCSKHPTGFCSLLTGIDALTSPSKEIAIIGPANRADTNVLNVVINKYKRKTWCLIPVEPGPKQQELANILPWVASMTLLQSQATAYVCTHFACQEPTTSAEKLIEQLQQ